MFRLTKNHLRSLSVAVSFMLLITASGCSLRRGNRADCNARLVYESQPDHPEIFASATETAPLRVCILKVDVNWGAGGDEGDQAVVWEYSYSDGLGELKTATVRFGPARAYSPGSGRLWENAIRSQLGELLQNQARAAGKAVQLVSRDELDAYLREKDLKLADVVEHDQLSEKAKLLDIDLYILGQISGHTVVRTRTKSSPASVLGSFVPYAGGASSALSRPKQEVTRTITIAGNLKAQDAKTGKLWLTHDITQQKIEDKKPRLWEGDVYPEDLMPEEQQIKRLLDPEVRRFVGRMLPTPWYVDCTVRSSGNADSKEGVRSLELQEDESALAAFQAALAENPRDHRSAFGAGVACERLGRLREAKEYYRQAHLNSTRKDDPQGQYQMAYDRVQRRMEREGQPDGESVSSASPTKARP